MSVADKLRTRLTDLITAVEAAPHEHAARISQVAPVHRPGAVNLVRYMALRSHDAVQVQEGLSSLGATSLSHPEPAVLERLHAAHNVLDAFESAPLSYPMQPIATAYASADDILESNTATLLGPTQEDTHARIMVTLPAEAADDYELVLGFAQAGMELARINCAHDDESVWSRMVDNVHRAAHEVGREILISCDLAGPKVRTGDITPGPAVVRVRVTRKPSGEVIAPATLVVHAPGADPSATIAAATSPLAQRPVVPLLVDAAWLNNLHPGAVATLRDVHGRKRTFLIDAVDSQAQTAVLHGTKNSYIGTKTVLECEGKTTSLSGIAPLEQKLRLAVGDHAILTTDAAPAVVRDEGPTTIGCTAPEAVRALGVGHTVLFDDGSIEATVVETRESAAGEHEAVLEVTRAGIGGTNLAAHKGINLPDTDIPLPSLTAEDLAAFRFVATHCDIAAVSFIRTPDDVAFVLESLEAIAQDVAATDGAEAAERVRNLGIVLKIETIPAYEQLGSLLLEGMRHPKFGIMIARGDLAVELGFEKMVQVPGRIMKVAEAAHIPVIMATQVLENLAKNGLPSRAEITDAGYALRAECVMLNKGPHITEAIQILDRMSRKLGRTRLKNRQKLRQIGSWEHALG
ncbi:TPA: pyruvate kinase [Corynebacterium striatum]|nr:pyruvate kinase [Corynebacterium striatum]